MGKNKKGRLEMFYKDKVVNREDLFRLASSIYFTAKDHFRRAKYAKENNDYIAYLDAKENFEDTLQMIKNPVFSEWSYAKELEDLQMPVFTVQDWIDTADNLQEVMFTDQSSIAIDDDDNDVPF